MKPSEQFLNKLNELFEEEFNSRTINEAKDVKSINDIFRDKSYVEDLNRGTAIENVRIADVDYPVRISPMTYGNISTPAYLLASYNVPVNQIQREGPWPPGGPPAPAPPAGYQPIPLTNGSPDNPSWDPVNGAPDERGKEIVYNPETGKLSISSAGESVEFDWDNLKPAPPVAPVPDPEGRCQSGDGPKTSVKVDVVDIKAYIREINCNTRIIVVIKWKITYTIFRCVGPSQNYRRWRQDEREPNNPREEEKENHKATTVSLPLNSV